MNLIKQWALGMTVSAIVGAVIMILSPKGGTEKIVRTAVSLFLLCAIINPFLSGVDIDGLLTDVRVESKAPDTQRVKIGLDEQMEKVIIKKTETILSANGIKDAEINIDISIDENNNMSIRSAVIKVKENEMHNLSAACEEIRSQLGIVVQTEVKK